MSNLPEGEQLQKAIKFISEERERNPGLKLFQLISEASLKFDLGPKDGDFLLRFFSEQKKDT